MMRMRGLRRGMLEQDRFEKDLVDAMRRLRRRPVAVRAVLRREAIAAAGNRNPRQFLPGERGAIADVVRIIRRQSGVAHLFRDPEPPEDFHGAGGDVVAFRLRRRGAGARLHHRDVDAAPRQIDRERQPDRSCADDQHVGSVISGIDTLAGRFTGHARSFQLGARILDDHGPAIDLGLDVGRKTVRRRSGQRLQRDRRELVARGGIGHQLSDLRRQLVDDRPRQAGGRRPRPARRRVRSRQGRLRPASECRAPRRPASAW